MTITETQLQRYARQVIMPEIDEDGQQALLSSRVTILGAGGLGSPVIANLAAAGVGKLIICDDDRVELSNLNRQFIYQEANVGQPKTQAAKKAAPQRATVGLVEVCHLCLVMWVWPLPLVLLCQMAM